jgi:hypothetical protein
MRCCNPSTSLSPLKNSARTAPISAFTTSRGSLLRPFRCWPRQARTSRIELGTAVIDMRYENPLYMAEDAGAADLIAGGRLQLGISRGSPEQVIDGYRYFGYNPPEGMTDADMARKHAEVFLQVLEGKGFAEPNPRPMFPNPPGLLRPEPHSEGLRDRIWWGAATTPTAEWAAKIGVNLQSSTLVFDETASLSMCSRPSRSAPIKPPGKEAGRGRAPRFGQPQHLCSRERAGPHVFWRRRQPGSFRLYRA